MAEAQDHEETLQQDVNSQFTDAKEEPVSISENQNDSLQQEVNPQFTDAKEEPISTSESLQREVSLQFADAKEEPVSISEEGEASGLEKNNETLSKIEGEEAEEQSSEAATQIKELESQLNAMKVELEALNIKKSELELQVESHATEAQQLRDENLNLNTRVSELEEMAEKSKLETAELDLQQELVSIQIQNSYLEQSMKCIRNEASNQVKDLIDRVNVMQQDLGHTQNTESQVSEAPKRVLEEKEELEVKIKELELGADTQLNQRNELTQQIKSKVHETIQLKDEKEELHARIFELEGIVTAREKDLSDLQTKPESVEKLESSQIKDQPRNLKGSSESTKPESARSTISENISKFNKFSDQARISKTPNESTDKIQSSRSMLNIGKFNKNVKDSVESPKKMKGDQSVQRRMDDLAAEFRRHVEDKVRLLSQRIRVLEQLNAENGSTHKLLQQENKLLLAKVTSCETQFKKLKDLHKIARTTMKGLEFMASKLDEGDKDLDRLANMVNELQLAKNWIQQRYESIRQLGYTLDSLNAELEEKQEDIQKLEAKVEERDKEVLHVGEEKREVIRQLCVLTDHLREENQELKDMISKFNAKRSQTKR